MRKLAAVISTLFVIGLGACQSDSSATVARATVAGCISDDYRNGVYYFPCAQDTFGRALSDFRRKNPQIEIISVAPDDYGASGRTSGYFVIARDK